jgi:lipopolysaccharide export system permease protein
VILEKYIAKSLFKGWMLVLLVLAAVFGLISFIDQLEQTRLDYNALAAAQYTLLILPNQLVSLAPVIALLGTIVALATLDRNNELTVISCTGYPLRKLLWAVSVPTIALMFALWLCMEYATPQLQQSAEQRRHELRFGSDTWLADGGVWSTDGKRYIHLRKMSSGNKPEKIRLFEFGENGELVRSLRAESADVSKDRRWLFKVVREKRLQEGNLVTDRQDELAVDNLWSKNELPSLTLQADGMNLSVLYSYSQYLAENGQPVDKYLRTYWQKLLMPFTLCAMVLLATPISASISAGRDRSFGFNLGVGALVGIFFFLGAQIIYAVGQLLGWSEPLVALLPALIILLVAVYLLRRMRW